MTTAQLAAVSFLASYAGRTHELYAYQLRRWFDGCESNGLDPLLGIQRAHVELYIRGLGEAGLMASSTNTMLHGVRGFFRFAHIDGLIRHQRPVGLGGGRGPDRGLRAHHARPSSAAPGR